MWSSLVASAISRAIHLQSTRSISSPLYLAWNTYRTVAENVDVVKLTEAATSSIFDKPKSVKHASSLSLTNMFGYQSQFSG